MIALQFRDNDTYLRKSMAVTPLSFACSILIDHMSTNLVIADSQEW